MTVTKIEIRAKGVTITPLTPDELIEKYSKDHPEIKQIKDGKATTKKASGK